MIRENYYNLGGWTLEEYHDYWEGERKMEDIIKSGLFPKYVELLSEALKPSNENKNHSNSNKFQTSGF